MKLKSELYIQELNLLLIGLHLQVGMCVENLKKEKRKARIASFLAPWLSNDIWMMLAIKSNELVKHVAMISELREKIMQAEGTDDDMRCITFQEICDKSGEV